MLHVGVLPNHRRGATCSPTSPGSSSTRRTSTAACSARTSPTCCAGCGGVARAYGTEPRFVLASATIANPVELAERLTGCDVTLVDDDGAAHAERQIAMWNPPLIDEQTGARALGARRGGRPARRPRRERGADDLLPEVAPRHRADPEVHQAASSRSAGAPTSPSGSRRTAPATRRRSGARSSGGWPRASCWRSCATDALELGIDIGELDAAICVTFPGTVASLRQMWGRAGRRATGLAIYVAGDDALDQFFCRHPDEFLDRPVESAILDHESEEIHLAHLCAAAYELPLTPERRRVPRAALERLRRPARQARRAARARRPLPAARRGLPGGADRAALGVAGLGRGDRGRAAAR